MTKQNKVEENVEQILKKHPYTRQNNVRLIFQYWISVDQIPRKKWLEQHFNLTKPESITRARRKIQNDENKYTAPPEIELTRQEKQKYFKKHYRGEEEWS